MLALRNRSNKISRQRIVVFVGSPLEGQAADQDFMVHLAKRLRKNNVAVDFVAFGDGIEEGERSVLKSFVENASSGDNSCVEIRPRSAVQRKLTSVHDQTSCSCATWFPSTL